MPSLKKLSSSLYKDFSESLSHCTPQVISSAQKLFSHILKQTRYHSHISFLSTCLRNRLIPHGLRTTFQPTKFGPNQDNLYLRQIRSLQHQTSLQILRSTLAAMRRYLHSLQSALPQLRTTLSQTCKGPLLFFIYRRIHTLNKQFFLAISEIKDSKYRKLSCTYPHTRGSSTVPESSIGLSDVITHVAVTAPVAPTAAADRDVTSAPTDLGASAIAAQTTTPAITAQTTASTIARKIADGLATPAATGNDYGSFVATTISAPRLPSPQPLPPPLTSLTCRTTTPQVSPPPRRLSSLLVTPPSRKPSSPRITPPPRRLSPPYITPPPRLFPSQRMTPPPRLTPPPCLTPPPHQATSPRLTPPPHRSLSPPLTPPPPPAPVPHQVLASSLAGSSPSLQTSPSLRMKDQSSAEVSPSFPYALESMSSTRGEILNNSSAAFASVPTFTTKTPAHPLTTPSPASNAPQPPGHPVLASYPPSIYL
ncbi:mucin-2-like [Hemiscyllium ocellatum]|uniref:mucin-2-like n=1 Tax=Hemiscyllium ocellatum TaxID=170820 RepID=UPI002966EFC8|nr:mucin-2-like [Hemiscyllium ocellatum]XP_060689573.1 mucin-2-like [Hemiscyllium ocellatum]